MIKVLFLVALALLPEAVFSQAMDAPPPKRITKIVHIRYGNPNKIVDLVRPGTPVSVSGDNILKVIVLSGQPQYVASVEQTIKELDVPPAVSTANDIELIVYVIGASNNFGASVSGKDISTVEPVIKQLSAIFPYKDYELLSTMLLRSQQGKQASSSGIMNYRFGSGVSQQPGSYGIIYDDASVSSDKAKPIIHLNNFKFDAKVMLNISTIPNNIQYQSFNISTQSNIDIREGQKIVVGKTDVANDGSALFIVLSAKLVD